MCRSLNAGLVLTATLACGGTPSASTGPSPATPQASPTVTPSPFPPRVSLPVACVETVPRVRAAVDLIAEFGEQPQVMADAAATSRARFDKAIDDLDYSRRTAPEELAPYLGVIRDELSDIRAYLQRGGTRTNDFRAVTSSSLEIASRCGGAGR